MTKAFRRMAKCVCGRLYPLEDAFCDWVRQHPDLPSSQIGIADMDLFIHRYRFTHGRGFDCFCLIEVKTRSAPASPSQRDTLNMIGQLLRHSRKRTPTKKRIFKQASNPPAELYSTMRKSWVPYKAFGYHLLQLDGSTPDDSQEIRWDHHFINRPTLIRLLRFELDPDTLNPIDWRKHHIEPEDGTPPLFAA